MNNNNSSHFFGFGKRHEKLLLTKFSGGPAGAGSFYNNYFLVRGKGVACCYFGVLNFSRDLFASVNEEVLGFYLVRFVKQRLFVLKKIRSWRGVRHEQRLPVRGQRSKTNASTCKRCVLQ
jgi:hypothetical protein